jgi:prophage tail gpP-like protein
MDSIRIVITDKYGEVISDDNQYSDYSFVSDYNNLANPFSVTLVNVDFSVKAGDKIQLWVNDRIEYNGIIQRKQSSGEKSSRTVTLTGKDRAAILVESFCNNFKDFNNKTPKFIIEALINQTDFYVKPRGSAESIADSTGFNSADDVSSRNSATVADVNNSKTVDGYGYSTVYDQAFTALPARNHYKISVGDRVFDKINQLVKALGYEILYENAGTLYIGDLNQKRYNDPIEYSLTLRRDGLGNNILTYDFYEDISGRYSSIMVSSQVDDPDSDTVGYFKIAKDSTVPQIKFMAMQVDDAQESPRLIAIQEREDQRIEGFGVTYSVQGHTAENGEAWAVNRYANVYDDINDILQTLVIYSREFKFSKSGGTTTEIFLSKEKITSELEI